MTRNEVITYLEQYGVCCNKILILQEQLDALHDIEQSPKIQQLSDMPKGSLSDRDLSDIMVRIEQLQEKIDDRIVTSIKIQLEIEEYIVRNIDDPIEAAIIRKRYIELKHWSLIAREMKYSVSHAKNVRTKCIKKLKVSTK